MDNLFQEALNLRRLLKLKLRLLSLIKRDTLNVNIELNKTLNSIKILENKLRKEVMLFSDTRRAFANKAYQRLIYDLEEEINLLREEHNQIKIAYANYKNLNRRIKRIQRLLKKFYYANISQEKKLNI